MNNLIYLDEKNFEDTVNQAAGILAGGGVIAYPTETLYGLGALVSIDDAVGRLRAIKGKAGPMLVLVSGAEMAKRYAALEERAMRLIKRFWPGPLTLIFKTDAELFKNVRAGASGMAMRASADPFAGSLVEKAGEPVISTSANRGGKEPLATGREIEKEFGSELDLIVDAGTRMGPPSTVIDLSGPELKLVREGVIKFDEIREAVK